MDSSQTRDAVCIGLSRVSAVVSVPVEMSQIETMALSGQWVASER